MKIISTILFILLLVPSLMAEIYVISGNSETDSVVFESPAKLEFIKGQTDKISGYFDISFGAPFILNGAVIQVDLTSLKTGIDLRDEHMYERHLHVDKYPEAFFEISNVDNLPEMFEAGLTYQLTGEGDFYLHGVKRTITPELIIVFNEHENQFSVSAGFDLKLDDYDIPRPKALFLKLAEIISIDIHFTAHQEYDPPTLNLPEWGQKNSQK